MPEWNPIQYEKFLKDRTQPAIELANRLVVLLWLPKKEV